MQFWCVFLYKDVAELVFAGKEGEEGFGEAEGEIEVADGIEAPNPPFEGNPQHQDDAAGEDGGLGQTVLPE